MEEDVEYMCSHIVLSFVSMDNDDSICTIVLLF